MQPMNQHNFLSQNMSYSAEERLITIQPLKVLLNNFFFFPLLWGSTEFWKKLHCVHGWMYVRLLKGKVHAFLHLLKPLR